MTKKFYDYLEEADKNSIRRKEQDSVSAALSQYFDKDRETVPMPKQTAKKTQPSPEELGPEAMDKYISMLKSHDWSYNYSDDHRVWSKGRDQAGEIKRLGDILDPDRKIYNKYKPSNNESIDELDRIKELSDINEITYEDVEKFHEDYGILWYNEDDELDEAEYQGRKVKLGKPTRGDVKKFKVYVKNPKGNVVKVNFGSKDHKIKKSNPDARRSFRARHNCDNPGPRHKARYWSCRKW